MVLNCVYLLGFLSVGLRGNLVLAVIGCNMRYLIIQSGRMCFLCNHYFANRKPKKGMVKFSICYL